MIELCNELEELNLVESIHQLPTQTMSILWLMHYTIEPCVLQTLMHCVCACSLGNTWKVAWGSANFSLQQKHP